MLDIIVVGGGPAGLSAAITARQRDLDVAVITNDSTKSGLYKAPEVGNYPGLPGISGQELLQRLTDHASAVGAKLFIGRVSTILPSGNTFGVGYGSDILTSSSVILATGISQTSSFPGEAELLGRGVSYCATCDGMLYRGKRVCVICLTPEAFDEAKYLESIGCDVVRIENRRIEINGDKQVTSVTVDGEEIICEGVFILRHTIAPNSLLTNLKTDKGHIRVSLSGETSISGVFAAGDCTGAPYQIAKAVGQGQVAVLSASDYIRKR